MSKSDAVRIYEDAFGREEEFEKELFSNCLKHLKTLKINGETVSILFLLPVCFNLDNKTTSGYYLFAAATDKKQRSRGYMGQLLKKILAETNAPIILKPANEHLISFYEKFGFECFNARYQKNEKFFISPIDEFLKLNPQAEEKSGSYTAMCYGIDIKAVENISFQFTME